MKKRCRKPTAAEWIFCLLLIPVGVFFSNAAHYVEAFSCIGVGGGIGGLIGLSWRLHSYNKLSPQQKREVELEERDERNIVIREKAGNITWKVLIAGLFGAAIIASWFDFTITLVCYALALAGLIVNIGAEIWLRNKM